MVHPHFIFIQLFNSYKVTVTNLEELDVKQIQEIEEFVRERKGIFDFHTYSFVIQKRIGFDEFVKLLDFLGIKATVEEKFLEYKKEHRIGFGQYKGLTYKELPDSYLLWLKNNYRGPEKKYINKELQLRKL